MAASPEAPRPGGECSSTARLSLGTAAGGLLFGPDANTHQDGKIGDLILKLDKDAERPIQLYANAFQNCDFTPPPWWVGGGVGA